MRPLLWLSLDKVKNVRLCWARALSDSHSENGSFVLVNNSGEKHLGIWHDFPSWRIFFQMVWHNQPVLEHQNGIYLHFIQYCFYLPFAPKNTLRLRFLGPFGQRHPFLHGFSTQQWTVAVEATVILPHLRKVGRLGSATQDVEKDLWWFGGSTMPGYKVKKQIRVFIALWFFEIPPVKWLCLLLMFCE